MSFNHPPFTPPSKQLPWWRKRKSMRLILIGSVLFLGFVVYLTCTERVPPGYVGIIEHLTGSRRGTDQVTEKNGLVWYFPFTQRVHKFPTFIQNAVYTAGADEGSPLNQEIVVTTRDGMRVSFDVSLNYQVDGELARQIFLKYRQDLEVLNGTVIRNYVRKAYNTMAGHYRAQEMYELRGEYEIKVEQEVRQLLEPEGFLVQSVQINSDLRMPAAIQSSITNKIQADQIAAQKQSQKMQVYWDGQKQIEAARADSSARVTKAKADSTVTLITAQANAQAYQLKRQTLTPLLLQQQWIDKWNGALPQQYLQGSGPSFLYGFNR